MEEIQKYECLLNNICRDYKNKFIRLNCWKKNRGKVSGYSRRSGKEVQVHPQFIRCHLSFHLAGKYETRIQALPSTLDLTGDRGNQIEILNRLDLLHTTSSDRGDYMETRFQEDDTDTAKKFKYR